MKNFLIALLACVLALGIPTTSEARGHGGHGRGHYHGHGGYHRGNYHGYHHGYGGYNTYYNGYYANPYPVVTPRPAVIVTPNGTAVRP